MSAAAESSHRRFLFEVILQTFVLQRCNIIPSFLLPPTPKDLAPSDNINEKTPFHRNGKVINGSSFPSKPPSMLQCSVALIWLPTYVVTNNHNRRVRLLPPCCYPPFVISNLLGLPALRLTATGIHKPSPVDHRHTLAHRQVDGRVNPRDSSPRHPRVCFVCFIDELGGNIVG